MYSDHITEGDQNIFLLRIKKNAEYSEQKNRNVELELRTPKPPTPLPAPASTPVITVAPSQLYHQQPVADLTADVEKPDMAEEVTEQPEKVTEQPAKVLKKKKKKKIRS